MPPATRFRPAGAGRWRRRAEDRIAVARWRAWQVRRPGLRSTRPVLLGPGAWIGVHGAGRIEVGRDVRSRGDLTLAVEGTLTIGDHVFLGRGVHITCFERVVIGSGTRFGERVSVHDENHVMEPLAERAARVADYDVAP